MSRQNQQQPSEIGASLNELLKKIVLAFCEVNVKFTSRLDIYGSLHVRADDCDIACFVLNEHTYRQELDDNVVESVDERHTSDCNGSMPARTSACRNVGKDYRGQRLLIKDNQLPPAQGDVEALSNGTSFESKVAAQASKSSVVEIQSSASDSEDIKEFTDNLTQCNVLKQYPTGNDVSKIYDFDNSVSSSKQRQSENSRYNNDFSQNCSTFIDRGPNDTGNDKNVKFEQEDFTIAEPSISETGESYFETENGVHSQGVFCDDAVCNFTQGYNSDQYFSGNMYESKVQTQVADWSCEYEASAPQDHRIAAVSSEKLCEVCLKWFSSEFSLKRHNRVVHSDIYKGSMLYSSQGPTSACTLPLNGSTAVKYTCSVCGLKFRSRDGLRCHENSIHSCNKVYRCQFCSQSFTTRQASYRHRIKYHRLTKRN